MHVFELRYGNASRNGSGDLQLGEGKEGLKKYKTSLIPPAQKRILSFYSLQLWQAAAAQNISQIFLMICRGLLVIGRNPYSSNWFVLNIWPGKALFLKNPASKAD